MEVLVIYESLYGNTRTVAEALAEGVQEADRSARVSVLPVRDASPERLAPADLLLVGGPTHALGMSRPGTRRAASDGHPQDQNEHGGHGRATGDGIGVREWAEALPPARVGARAAAFDTRLSSPLAGSAARGIAKTLRRLGYELIARPEGFVVVGAEGPLRPGERERACAWAAGVVTQLLARTAP